MAGARKILAQRELISDEAEAVVEPILAAVRDRGDDAVREFAARFDGFAGPSFTRKVVDLTPTVPSDLEDALQVAAGNIRAFSQKQRPQGFMTELAPGHRVGQVLRPLSRIAAYVPGGRYPYPSTALMTAIPARVAGVGEVWLTTPQPTPAVERAAQIAGADAIATLGGAQAIAAFAFGTETIPQVDKIVGPGNAYVTAAKKLLAGTVSIDFLAGPTEVVIVGSQGNPAWIAADLLAQAEHDATASAIFITTSAQLAVLVQAEVARQLATLPTAAVAKQSLAQGSFIAVVPSRSAALDLANEIAAEHLCLLDPEDIDDIQHAGSIFIGSTSPEAAGDYVTGPNHVLPTGGAARRHGGLSVMDFLRVVTVQQLSPSALANVASAGARLARAEGLEGHARSIEIRQGEPV